MVHQLKAALRREMLSKRDSLKKPEIERMSMAIGRRLLSHQRFSEANAIGFYISKGSEVETRWAIGEALRLGKAVLAPVTDDHKIAFHPLSSLSELVPGKFGIMEPPCGPGQKQGAAKPEHNLKNSKTPSTIPPPCPEPDLVIVPGVSFGLCMHRLGYGRGYYDRYLSESSAYRIGICFDFQVVLRLPHHENDERMDEIITEKRAIRL